MSLIWLEWSDQRSFLLVSDISTEAWKLHLVVQIGSQSKKCTITSSNNYSSINYSSINYSSINCSSNTYSSNTYSSNSYNRSSSNNNSSIYLQFSIVPVAGCLPVAGFLPVAGCLPVAEWLRPPTRNRRRWVGRRAKRSPCRRAPIRTRGFAIPSKDSTLRSKSSSAEAPRYLTKWYSIFFLLLPSPSSSHWFLIDGSWYCQNKREREKKSIKDHCSARIAPEFRNPKVPIWVFLISNPSVD